MTPRALALQVPINVLRACVVGRRVECAGFVFTAFAYPVYVTCRLLANTDLPDSSVEFRWGTEPPSCTVDSFRDVARWVPGRPKWRRI